MAESHSGSVGKTKTGAKIKPKGDKKKASLGRERIELSIGKSMKKKISTMGNTEKIILKSAEFANVMDPATKKCKKVKIASVKENAANRHFVRRNIVTLGAVIETEAGPARVTSRPGQSGVVNAVLLSK